MPWKILIAADSTLHARARRALEGCTFFGRVPEVLTARSSAETIEQVLRNPDLAVLVTDTTLEGERAGLDAVEAIRGHLHQRRLRIVLCTGARAPEHDFIVRHDVHDYAGAADITERELQTLVRSALRHYQQLAALDRPRTDVPEATDPDSGATAELVSWMERAVEEHGHESANHLRRVGEYARLLGQFAGLDEEASDLLRRAAPLHDAGKLAIPHDVLDKPGPHTDEESAIMRKHAQLGAEMLARHDSPVLRAAAIIASEHHERWDGSGYPNGWRGEQIHLFGRITALADVFDALTHARIYQSAWPLERTVAYLREESGKRFDPELVDVFLANLDQFVAIHTRLPDPPLMH